MCGMFKDILGSSESLFKNNSDTPLDFSFIPKPIKYRENEQKQIAACMRPLFQEKTGRHIFVYGQPGVGKTAACRHLLREIEDETEEIVPIYINCWKLNTTFKIVIEICDHMNFKFVQNRKTEELFRWIKQNLNKKSAVFVLDEADKLEDLDFLYMVLEEIARKSIVIIANYKDWITELDERIKSRLMPEILEFRPYNPEETKGIMRQRMEYAFHPNVWDSNAFELVAKKAAEMQDIRAGLYLMKQSGLIAEDKSSRKITLEHAQLALEKIRDFSIKNPEELAEDEQLILDLVRDNSGRKIGDFFKLYQQSGGKLVYKSFQRKIDKLQKNKFIIVEKTAGGEDGNTTIIKSNSEKKLTDF